MLALLHPPSRLAKKKTPEKKGLVITEPSELAQKRPKVTIKPFNEKKTAEEGKEKEKTKEKFVEKPVGADPKDTGAAATTASEKAQGPEITRITGLDQPHHEKRKETEVEKPTEPFPANAPVQTTQVTSTTGGSGSAPRKEKTNVAGGASFGGAGGFIPQNIGPKDTLGDIYYKTYTEESRDNAPHQAPWGLKQKDTFKEFGPCRDWFLNSFPPGEVNRQRARTHDGLYQAYVVGEANTRATNHQIVREWRTMIKERADWENYRERLVRQVKEFEKANTKFDEEKTKFEVDRKSEEWGHAGLRSKLHAAEDLLAKERADWKKICAKDNDRMYADRAKITDLEGQVTELKGKVEDAQAAKEQAKLR
ncbi:hypothetical protein Hanom_Chr09g00762731 [Helianthus anomalus]